VTSKLFIKSFETLLKGYNDSYGRMTDDNMTKLVPTVKKDGDNYNIWNTDDRVMGHVLIELVIAATKHMCGGSYYVDYNQTAKRLEIHIF